MGVLYYVHSIITMYIVYNVINIILFTMYIVCVILYWKGGIYMNEKKKKYDIEYMKNNYKRVGLDLTPTKYNEVKLVADSLGMSVNGFIKKAIDYFIESSVAP